MVDLLNEDDDLYKTLGIHATASFDEMKHSYQQLLLQKHPDKLRSHSSREDPGQGPVDAPPSEAEANDHFIKIRSAWKILSDPESRREYDFKQRMKASSAVAAEEVPLAAFTVGEDGCLSYGCRCGDFFEVSSRLFKRVVYVF